MLHRSRRLADPGRFGLPEGQALPRSIIEFYFKDDKLGDPLCTEEHITAFNWATTQEIDDMLLMTCSVNDYPLSGMLLERWASPWWTSRSSSPPVEGDFAR